jgi:hypothetical protein
MALFLSFRRVLRLLLAITYTWFFQKNGTEWPKGTFAESRRKSGGTLAENFLTENV